MDNAIPNIPNRAQLRRNRFPLRRLAIATVALGLATAGPIRALAAPPPPPPPPSYADLVDIADAAPFIVGLEIRQQSRVEPARAPDLPAGRARLYVEARPVQVLAGSPPLLPALHFLVDVALDARGKVPSLRKRRVLAFARSVPDQPDAIQLVAGKAMVNWDPATESRVRAVLAELHADGAPGRIVAVKDALYVPGTLSGAGETQITLTTAGGKTASISIAHQPGQNAQWSASFGEVFDIAGGAPPRDTLAWYRLACFLPRELPAGANLSVDADDREQAAADYRLVIAGLGDCPRAPE